MNEIQKKVDSLIILVNSFKETFCCFEQNKLSQNINRAIYCLKSHDLIGLDIIQKTINGNVLFQNLKDDNIIKIKKQILQLINEIKLDYKKSEIQISSSEKLFLDLSYNKFFDIFSEVYSKDFWGKDSKYRLGRIFQAFSVYNEIIKYEPFRGVFKWLEKNRPPMEVEISNSLFKFIRNVLTHFPFFDSWNEIWINKSLVNWDQPNQSIDRFLEKHCGKHEVEYRFKENSNHGFTYVTINFPKKYGDETIYLKDIICEEEGIRFALIMMLRVLNTQIESINEY